MSTPALFYAMFCELIASAPATPLDECVTILRLRTGGELPDDAIAHWHAQWQAMRIALRDHAKKHMQAKELEAAGKHFAQTPTPLQITPALRDMLDGMKVDATAAATTPSES